MKISCIIPAYNEGKRISEVLDAVCACRALDEVIVIDDGSQDDTVDRVKPYLSRVTLLVQKENSGKSAAVARGISEALGEYILLLDADLVGLTPEILESLVSPVASGIADMSMSLRKNTPWLWRVIGIDYISGERLVPSAFLKQCADEIRTLPGFGLEVFLNARIIQNRFRIAVVPCINLRSPYKAEKFGFLAGSVADIKMMAHIFSIANPLTLLKQILVMRHRRVSF
jgi:glycosyltransferase involved in cell wall biosynthesis